MSFARQGPPSKVGLFGAKCSQEKCGTKEEGELNLSVPIIAQRGHYLQEFMNKVPDSCLYQRRSSDIQLHRFFELGKFFRVYEDPV